MVRAVSRSYVLGFGEVLMGGGDFVRCSGKDAFLLAGKVKGSGLAVVDDFF